MRITTTSHSKDDSRYYCSDVSLAIVMARVEELGELVGVNTYDIDGVLVELDEDEELVIFTLKHELARIRDQVWRSICRLFS